MKKNVSTILLLIVFVSNNYSQTTKLFNGKLDLGITGIWQDADVSYNYYEDSSYNYVKHGLFKLSFIGSGNYKGINENIQGNFKNGLKNGTWTYDYNNNDIYQNDYYVTSNIKLTANYVDGLPDGTWTCIVQGKNRNKKYNRNTKKMEFGPWMNSLYKSTSAKFKKGILIGNLTIIEKNNEKIIETNNINFNDKGFYNGKYYTKDTENEVVNEYENGFLIKSIVRDLKTGQASVTDNSNKLITFRDLYNNENNKDFINNSEYRLHSYDNNYFRNLILNTFFGEQFNYKSIGGDLNYKEPNYNFEGISYRELKEK
ncbi:hypothetical protein ACSVH2_09545 [Flavobacterium sp. RSB2_4_14]|uniref:hypothetical protein n=1 Tax=Flavobacterium sp. RSB2_4_14 TaxID=3447665 RepID=UPI003F2E9CA6